MATQWRAEVRAQIPELQRIVLLENDVDTIEETTRSIVTRMNAILVSLVTGALLLAANLAVQLSER